MELLRDNGRCKDANQWILVLGKEHKKLMNLRKFWGRWLILVIILSLLPQVNLVSSQDDPDSDDPPPQVIDVWPLPGVEMGGTEPLSISFDQSMNADTVQNAFSIAPELAGEIVWSDPRTLNFIPSEGWAVDTEYTVTIAETALSTLTNLGLVEPYSVAVQTVGPLEVAAIAPAEDAENVAADSTIVVTFNRPVQPLVSTDELADLPPPISIEPEVAGTGEWVNTSIYVFTPEKVFDGGTTYTVTVAAGLTSIDAAVLAEEYTWSFSTLPPQIQNVYPYSGATRVLLEEKIIIYFSQPMDTTSAEEAFDLTNFRNLEPVVGTFSWDDTGQTMTFTPADLLNIETTYRVHIGDSAKSASGEATLSNAVSRDFTTVPLPGVESTNPHNGDTDVSPGRGAYISFKSPMKSNSLEDLIEISPEPESWTPSVGEDQTDYISLGFRSLPNTTYTITLKAGGEDLYGNVIENDYTFSFTTGDISTWFSPLTRGNFALTGAHRQNTRFAAQYSGTPTVEFTIYRLDNDASYMEEVFNGYYSGDRPVWATINNIHRQWTQEFDSNGSTNKVDEILLASENGGTLPNGIYWVNIESTYRYNNNNPWQKTTDEFALAVSTANLTVKRSPNELLVFMTDMPSADPVANATVSIYHHTNMIARGTTDADGVFRSPLSVDPRDPFVYIVAESDTAFGAWHSYNSRTAETENDYLYTDRPIYRPGETVNFRGALRLKNDMAYSLPNVREIPVIITSYATGETLFEEDVAVTEFGTFSGTFDLAEDVALSGVSIYADNKWLGEFTIAEFRVPEYAVSVEATEAEIVRGDSLDAVLHGEYYFGGAVSNADLYWYASGNIAYFNYTGPGRYNFIDETANYPYFYESGEGTTDAAGNFIVQSDNTDAGSTRPMSIVVEGTVTDESNQPISGRTSVFVHPANVYIGQRTDKYFGKANEEMTVDLISVHPDSSIVGEQKVDLTLIETRWERVPVEGQFGRYEWTQEEIEVLTETIITGEDGKAQFTFTPPNGGIFRLRATTLDERERVNSSTLRFWVIGDRPVWWGRPSTSIDLVADAEAYKPGDTAQILVPIPFAGGSTVLVTTERVGIMSHEVLAVEGSTLLYDLPITDEHAPTIHVSFTVIKGIDEESLNPEYRQGTITLTVVPVEQQLTVTVTPSKELTQPRETVAFDILVTDAHGEPVVAEVGLRLTDKAILALLPDYSLSPEEAFYGWQSNHINTTVAITNLLDVLTDETLGTEEEKALGEEDLATGRDANEPTPAATATAESGLFADSDDAAGEALPDSGGGGGAEPPVIRENFEQTPLWAPHVVTATDGTATVSLELPDNLTTWSLQARVLTQDTKVGQAGTEIVTTLPLLVRPATPRFFVVDDRVELAMVINNNTPEDQTLEATLEAEGVTLETESNQTVTIGAGERLRVRWWATVDDSEFVDMTFFAVGDGFSDASKPSLANENGQIPVYRYTAPDTVGTAGLIRNTGSKTEGIALPSRIQAESGTITIKVDPSLAVSIIDSFDYLKNYKHQCIEQTVSRFLPNAITYKALKDLGIQDPELEAKLVVALTEGLTILEREQNPDGGWGWFSGMKSSYLVTAYAALGLIEAREAGFTIDESMLMRALSYVQDDLIRPTIDTTPWQLNRQAFYLYVMSRDGRGDKSRYDDLFEHRLDMSYMGRAYFLMAYVELFPEAGEISDLTSDLTSAAILSATGAHWEEDYNDWWNWSSDTRTTALVLSALTRVEPESDLLANAVRWLMIARDGDHWTTTQETVWSVIGLTDWMVITGELQGNYDYNISINRELQTEGTVTPETVREGATIEIPISELSTDELNRLTIARGEGEGVLYYTTHMNLRLPAAEAEAINRGINVQREYFLNDDPDTKITSAHIGDTITVRVTMTLTQDVYYFVLEDPIPAGTEGVNTSLLTTSQEVEGPNLQSQYRRYNPYWYWGWWWFDRTEMRDEQVNLYADFLPRGTYVYTYQLQATTPGEFQTMPSHAYAFYMPEVFGRTDGSLFTITDAPTEE